jgi:uncharacterized protein YndB with AHSA1/START domain
MLERNDVVTPDCELVTTRVFDAPRALVFEAWTSAEHLGQWWGPRGFTTKTHEFDFRVGGTWRLTMIGPDGREYPNRVVYQEIVRPSRIVYAHHGDGDAVHFRASATFEDAGAGKTRVTMRAIFASKAERDQVVERYGAAEGAKQTIARLGEHVGEMGFYAPPDAPSLTMTRVFDAPARLVFEATTRPEHLTRWWGPRSFTLSVCEVDLRPGGAYRFVCRAKDGKEFPFSGEWREIVPHERLVFTQRFDLDPSGGASVVTVVMHEHEGRTTVALTQTFETIEARDATIRTGAKDGSVESWDRLAELLAGIARTSEVS